MARKKCLVALISLFHFNSILCYSLSLFIFEQQFVLIWHLSSHYIINIKINSKDRLFLSTKTFLLKCVLFLHGLDEIKASAFWRLVRTFRINNEMNKYWNNVNTSQSALVWLFLILFREIYSWWIFPKKWWKLHTLQWSIRECWGKRKILEIIWNCWMLKNGLTGIEIFYTIRLMLL